MLVALQIARPTYCFRSCLFFRFRDCLPSTTDPMDSFYARWSRRSDIVVAFLSTEDSDGVDESEWNLFYHAHRPSGWSRSFSSQWSGRKRARIK